MRFYYFLFQRIRVKFAKLNFHISFRARGSAAIEERRMVEWLSADDVRNATPLVSNVPDRSLTTASPSSLCQSFVAPVANSIASRPAPVPTLCQKTALECVKYSISHPERTGGTRVTLLHVEWLFPSRKKIAEVPCPRRAGEGETTGVYSLVVENNERKAKKKDIIHTPKKTCIKCSVRVLEVIMRKLVYKTSGTVVLK